MVYYFEGKTHDFERKMMEKGSFLEEILWKGLARASHKGPWALCDGLRHLASFPMGFVWCSSGHFSLMASRQRAHGLGRTSSGWWELTSASSSRLPLVPCRAAQEFCPRDFGEGRLGVWQKAPEGLKAGCLATGFRGFGRWCPGYTSMFN